MNPLDLLWVFFILSSLQPMVQQRILTAQRARALRQLEKRDRSRGITLIHRRDGFSFLGIPFGGYINIDDSEASSPPSRSPPHSLRIRHRSKCTSPITR